MDKIDELVKHEVSKELFRFFPGEIISVTHAEVSKDLAYAKVWISALGDIDRILARSQSCAKEITRELAKRLKTKKVPKLTFLNDFSYIHARQIDDLIDEIHKEKP
jgi:ribosome-binding factor A